MSHSVVELLKETIKNILFSYYEPLHIYNEETYIEETNL